MSTYSYVGMHRALAVHTPWPGSIYDIGTYRCRGGRLYRGCHGDVVDLYSRPDAARTARHDLYGCIYMDTCVAVDVHRHMHCIILYIYSYIAVAIVYRQCRYIRALMDMMVPIHVVIIQ